MLTSSVRVRGERDSWWKDVVNLLSGRGIRRNDPERLAIEMAIGKLKAKLSGQTPNVPTAAIGLAISHDGSGPSRGVTAVVFTNPGEAGSRDEGQDMPIAKEAP